MAMKPRTLLGSLLVLVLLACGDTTSPTEPAPELTGAWGGTWEFAPGEWRVGDFDGYGGRLHAGYAFGEDMLVVWVVEFFDITGEVRTVIDFRIEADTLSFEPPLLILDGRTAGLPAQFAVSSEGLVASDMSRIDLVALPEFAFACVTYNPCRGTTIVTSDPTEIRLTLRPPPVPP